MIIRHGRGILSLLSDLVGTRAVDGVARFQATTDPIDVSATCPLQACAVLNGQLRPEIVVETVGAATISPLGTDVPIRAHVGGLAGNVPSGTPLVLLPPEPGLEAAATIITGPTGGTNATGWGVLAMTRLLQEVRPGKSGEDLFRGGVFRLPAACLAWAGRFPYSEGAVRKAAERKYLQRWQLHVVVTTEAGDDRRRMEALDLVDAIDARIESSTCTETGEAISSLPDGVHVENIRPLQVSSGAYVYVMTLRHVIIANIDALRRHSAPSPWLETFAQYTTTEATAHADDPKVVVDHGWDQP